jgi:VWFA-related protein
MRPAFLALACAGLCFAETFAQEAQAPPRQPAVTFRAEVNYVDVDAIVTDQHGTFVKDLTKEDFEVFEDGKPQKVEILSLVDLPVQEPEKRSDEVLVAGRRVVNDVKTNARAAEGRLYVIVLDDLDTSTFRANALKRTAHEFIEKYLNQNDVAAVLYTSGRPDAQQDFTSERPLLLAAVDKFIGRKFRSYTLEKVDNYFYQLNELQTQASMLRYDQQAANEGPMAGTNTGAESYGYSTDPSVNPLTRGEGYPDRTGDSEDFERGHRALGVLRELRDLADFMGSVHGRRKALLLFSEGIDYPTTDIFGAQEATMVTRAMQDAITAAARGNVSFYGVDPRGLVGMSADAVGELMVPAPSSDPAAGGATLSSFLAEMRLSQDSLQSLSDETGGFASVGANDPAPFFDRVVSANSTYYMLGYYSPNHPRDGRFHKIEVRVRRPGMSVSARRGYAAPRGGKTPEERAEDERQQMLRAARKGGADGTSADLRASLNLPMQQGGLTMAVQAAAFRNTAKEASVALTIELDSSSLHFEPRNNGAVFADKLELSYFSVNEQSKPLLGMRHELDLTLKPDGYDRVRQMGLRMNPRIALAPGRYQLRIGMRESGNGALGTVFYDLQVPDFTKEPLSMSGMLLTAGTSQLVPTVLSDKGVGAEFLPGPATSRRTFAEGDELTLYVEVYQNLRTPNKDVAFTTHLVGDDGREVFASREMLKAPAQRGSEPTTFGVPKNVSLKGVRAGRYVLQVEAQAPGRDPITVWRETVLTVVSAASR